LQLALERNLDTLLDKKLEDELFGSIFLESQHREGGLIHNKNKERVCPGAYNVHPKDLDCRPTAKAE
jgi:hypothetical protein